MLRIVWSYVKILSTVAFYYWASHVGVVSVEKATTWTCNIAISENVLFIKCIQAMSSHPSIPTAMHPILQTYTNSVPVRDSDVDAVLLRYVCQKYSLVLDQARTHSGMVAFVFHGTMNQLPVVVKVAKIGIVHRITDGCAHLRVLRAILCCMSRWNTDARNMCDVIDVVIDSADYLRQQCDLTHEQHAMKNVRCDWMTLQAKYASTSSVCNHLNRINVPRVFNEADERYSSSFYIMEKVSGVPAFTLKDVGVKRRSTALLQYFIISQAMFFDYYHTDMHSGNILFDYNDDDDTLTLGIYDYGMHVRFSEDDRLYASNLIDVVMNIDAANKPSFDAVRFCRLLFEVPENAQILDTPTLREVIGKFGNDMLTGAMSAELANAFLKCVSSLLGIDPKIKKVHMQILLGTSMVNSLTYELSDNNMSMVAESCIRVYGDIFLS
jgi:hypothetical protein